jgi:hypothetical protein
MQKIIIIKSIFFYILFLFLFLFFTQEGYTTTNGFVAWSVFVFGTFPAIRYVIIKSTHIPLIELILLVHVAMFTFPLFFQKEQMIFSKILTPINEPITITLLLVFLAIICYYIGYRLSPRILRKLKFPCIRFDIRDNKLFYYGLIICIVVILGIRDTSLPLQGLLNIIFNQNFGIALLSILYYKGSISPIKKIIFIITLISMVTQGISTSMTELILMPLIIVYFIRWFITGKIEKLAFVFGVAIFIALQPVKLEYRNLSYGLEMSGVEKVSLFSNIFYKKWIGSVDEQEVHKSTGERVSLLLQTAHVVDLTPATVDYKNGEMVSIFLASFIPRIVWDDKPIIQQANIDYAIEYGITTYEGVKTSMFGIGNLGDTYSNFGITGIIPVYILLGIFSYSVLYLLSVPKNVRTLLLRKNHDFITAPLALSITILFQLLAIGSSVADTLSPVIQLIIVHSLLIYIFSKKYVYKKE